MMKKILLLLIFVISTLLLVAQTNSTGNGEWATVVQPSYTIAGGNEVNIQHIVHADEELVVILGGTLNIVSDSLIAKAGVVTFIGATVVVEENAVLYIVGDLDNTLWGDITVNGTLKVDGDVSNFGSNVVVGENGYVGIGGDFDNTGGSVENGDGGTFNVGGDIIGVDPEDNINSVTPEEALPIELLHFYGDYDYNKTTLYWATASETNNDYFVIYYSLDAVNWDELGTITGAGNSSTIINYNYNHYTKKSYYYTIKQVDYDGANETFNSIFVQSDNIDMDRTYDVYDINGRFIRQGKTSDIQNLQKGIYFLRYNKETHKIYID